MIYGLRSVRLEVIWAWYHSARRVTSQSAYVHVPLYWQIPDIDSPAAVGQYIMAPSHTSRRSDCSRAFLVEGARLDCSMVVPFLTIINKYFILADTVEG
jgi:hypothetical protein